LEFEENISLDLRKLILLKRYTDFFKNFLTNRSADIQSQDFLKMAKVYKAEKKKEKSEKSEKEKVEKELNAHDYRKEFSDFIDYFKMEMNIIGDPDLSEELKMLQTVFDLLPKKDKKVEPQIKVEENLLCSICLNSQKSILIMPCKHICMCEPCSVGIDACPLCREKIEQKVRIGGWKNMTKVKSPRKHIKVNEDRGVEGVSMTGVTQPQ